jgi:hypothetical protein
MKITHEDSKPNFTFLPLSLNLKHFPPITCCTWNSYQNITCLKEAYLAIYLERILLSSLNSSTHCSYCTFVTSQFVANDNSFVLGLLCYHWLSFRNHESSLHRVFTWFVFFSLGCVYLCCHLLCTFDGWVLILVFYLHGFSFSQLHCMHAQHQIYPLQVHVHKLDWRNKVQETKHMFITHPHIIIPF